ncbi:hypothetical protein FO519_005838 [Halicephalobus sp. NKZ332]|nr:hypothetical protein FO519_005838 [Halicephalobus sp. NKZ332]
MPKKNKKTIKKTGPTAPELSAAGKKREKDGKKNELTQLQDSLSTFFTPTSSRRSRLLPQAQAEDGRDSDDSSSSSSTPSTSEAKVDEHDPGEAGPSWSNPVPLPPMKSVKKAGCPSLNYPPKTQEDPKKNKPRIKANPKKKSRKTQENSSEEEEEEEVIPSGRPRKYYYKGFWFADCPNGVLDPNGIGARELIEVFKSMEAINRRDPNFKEFSDIGSDTSFEEDKNHMDRQHFRDTNDYLNYCKKKLQKKVKVRDGLTKKQRKEHRQFKREFSELLECLEKGHLAVCDDEFNDFVDSSNEKQIQKFSKSSIEVDPEHQDIKKYKNTESQYQYPLEFEMFSDTDDEYGDYRDKNGRNFEFEEPMEEGQPIPAEDLVDFREQFEALDFKPVVDRVPSWREMLPPKSPRSGHSRASPESSITTLSNESQKPVDYDIVKASGPRPSGYQRYRSELSRVMYRRLVRRACRNWVSRNNRRKQIHKFLQIGKHCPENQVPLKAPKQRLQPRRPSLTEDLRDYMDPDDGVQNGTRPLSYEEILERLSPEMRRSFKEIFEDLKKKTEDRLKAVSEAKGPVPKFIHTNKFRIKTLYSGLFPEALQTPSDLYICDLCLQGFLQKYQFDDHMDRCEVDSPPGKEIYRDDEYKVSVFEVDAVQASTYTMMLCAWARCYIDHKALWQDIEPFLFYVLVRRDGNSRRNRFVGYFSKQKYQHSQCNLCCLLILPCYQGFGYGRFLIDFSFLLSKVEKIPGTPERPLSEAADVLYYKYYVDSFYETVFGVYYELTKKGENPEQNHPLTLGWLEEKTAINKTDLLKVLVHEKIAEIIYDKKNPRKAIDVKFNVDFLLHRGMTLEEFEEKVSDPEVSYSTPFCNKDDIYMTVPVKRPPKNGPAFVVEKRTPSPIKSPQGSHGEVSSDEENMKQGKKRISKKSCKPKSVQKKFSSDDESDDDKSEHHGSRAKKSGRGGRPTVSRTRKTSSPEKKSQNESASKCTVMSIGSPKVKSTPRSTKKQVHSSEDEAVQHVRARIRGSSLESSSSDEDIRHRSSRKRSTRQLKNDDALDAGNPSKRSSRQVESALENDEELQHEDPGDLGFDPYDYQSQMAPFQNVRKDPEPLQMEVVEEKKEEAEMPKLIPTLQVTNMEEDDEDDDAPPMLSPNYGQMPELISNTCPPFEQEQRAQSEESDGPPVLQNSNIPVESMEIQNQPQIGNQEALMETPVNIQNEPSRRSSTEQYQLQNSVPPGSSGLQPTFPGSIGHPASAGSLHPGSAGNLQPGTTHTYPNSTGTPQIAPVQNNPPSWSLPYPINQQEDQNLSFSMSAPQNSQVMDLEYPRPEISKDPPKPKKAPPKKKKKESSTPALLPPPKYPMQQAYDPTFGATPFLPYNNPMAMVAAGPSGYYPYTQGVQAGTYNQNTMPWSAGAYNYSNFMTNPLQPTLAGAQPRFFSNYPLIPGTTAPTPAATLANPVSQGWQRPQNPAPNASQFYSYPYPYYQT